MVFITIERAFACFNLNRARQRGSGITYASSSPEPEEAGKRKGPIRFIVILNLFQDLVFKFVGAASSRDSLSPSRLKGEGSKEDVLRQAQDERSL